MLLSEFLKGLKNSLYMRTKDAVVKDAYWGDPKDRVEFIEYKGYYIIRNTVNGNCNIVDKNDRPILGTNYKSSVAEAKKHIDATKDAGNSSQTKKELQQAKSDMEEAKRRGKDNPIEYFTEKVKRLEKELASSKDSADAYPIQHKGHQIWKYGDEQAWWVEKDGRVLSKFEESVSNAKEFINKAAGSKDSTLDFSQYITADGADYYQLIVIAARRRNKAFIGRREAKELVEDMLRAHRQPLDEAAFNQAYEEFKNANANRMVYRKDSEEE